MRDIKSLLVPGVGILRLEDSEDAFAFPAGALQEFFVKAGCGHIDSPQRFTIQLLAGSTLYTDMLPPHLKHVPSLGRLLRVAQLLADYDPRKQPEGSARWEATAEELAARLRELFIVGKSGTVDFAIHQEDADLILADLGPADSTVDPRAFMAELQGTICRSLKHYRAQRDWSQRSTLDECALTPEAVRDAKKREQSAVEAAAKQAAELVIAKKHYPAPLIHGFIVTTSGEEV